MRQKGENKGRRTIHIRKWHGHISLEGKERPYSSRAGRSRPKKVRDRKVDQIITRLKWRYEDKDDRYGISEIKVLRLCAKQSGCAGKIKNLSASLGKRKVVLVTDLREVSAVV